VSASPFGWHIEHGKESGFTFGGKVWSPDGDKPASVPDSVINSHYTPRGMLQPWIDAAKMITDQQRPALDLILASAFAAPLTRFTGEAGLLVSAFSTESGIGKSTSIKIAQAVWGDPRRGVQTLDDTTNSVANKIGALRHLPLYWDELKTEEATNRFVTFAFQLSQGKEKSRLDASAAQRDPGTWQTMMLVASNDSLLDYVTRRTRTTTAGVMRLFEFPVEPKRGLVKASEASRLTAALEDNFGRAGEVYAMHLGANHAEMRAAVSKAHSELEHELRSTPDERFWIATIATLVAGAHIANQLGLTDIAVPALREFAIEVLAKLRADLKDQPVDMNNSTSVANILQQYLNAMRARNTLVTDRVLTGAGRPPKDGVEIKTDLSKLEAVYVHIGTKNKIMRIASTHFRNWLKDRDYSPNLTSEALIKQFGARKCNGRLGGGTRVAGMTEYLLELDMNTPELAAVVEYGDE
jgi:hypothetical protein